MSEAQLFLLTALLIIDFAGALRLRPVHSRYGLGRPAVGQDRHDPVA